MPENKPHIFRRTVAIAWLFWCTILFCTPGNALPNAPMVAIPGFDKWVHVFLFAVLAWLMLRAYVPAGSTPPSLLLPGLLAYGFAIEVVQGRFIPLRSFDLLDLAADAAGILLGLLFWQTGRKKN